MTNSNLKRYNRSRIKMLKDLNVKNNLLILGAGVSGLSTGILLLQKSYKVTIWAKDIPPHTTSNTAAAVWYPFSCGSPHKARGWLKETLEYFQNEVPFNTNSGCKKTTVVEIFDHEKKDPWWREGIESFQRINKDKLPGGYVDGYEIDGIVMDTDIYMNYLLNTFKELGGTIVIKNISSINEAFNEYSRVINCTGLDSRTLFGDESIYPCRGQIVKIKPNGFDYSLFEEEGPNSLAYIIPRLSDIVLGGTIQDNDWNLEVSEQDTKEILRKCSSILPQLKQVEILEIKVGLRPAREEIRLEIEKYSSDKFVIHNYGHGGSGFTLSWGCSQEVVELIESLG